MVKQAERRDDRRDRSSGAQAVRQPRLRGDEHRRHSRRAGVANAVYHHFASKEAIPRLVDAVQAELATSSPSPRSARRPVISSRTPCALPARRERARAQADPLDRRPRGDRLAGVARDRREVLRGGHAARRRRAARPRSGAAHVEAVAHLGAVMEAALVCATADDPRRSARDFSAGVRRLLAGLAG